MARTKLDSIELPATDLAATKKFYEDNFGWTFTDYGPTYAAARVLDMEIGFNTEARDVFVFRGRRGDLLKVLSSPVVPATST